MPIIKKILLIISCLYVPAFASWDMQVVNSTKKPIQFSMMRAPETTSSTELLTVNPGVQKVQFDQLPPCLDEPLCHGEQYYVVIQKWGAQTVFVRSEKLYNPKVGVLKMRIKIYGSDSSDLSLSASEVKSFATVPKRKKKLLSIK